jgi:tRNA(Ile)-lysidine synthase
VNLGHEVGRGADRLGIPRGTPLVLAVSGGSDSMALLHGAVEIGASRGWHLVVAHLDHGLRPESPDDAAFVVASAEALGLGWELRRVDVQAEAAAHRQGIEEAGRDARYAFLEWVAASLGPRALVATAHTADDQAETVLLNLVRGAGLRGARGMPSRRGVIVRPLLQTRREVLRGALDGLGVAYRDDPTNTDIEHARARLRTDLMPVLESLNPHVVAALERFASLAGEDDALLDDLAATELKRRRGRDGTLNWRKPPPTALGRRVLRLAIGDPAPPADRIEAVLAAAARGRGGVVIELGRGRTGLIRGRRIELRL